MAEAIALARVCNLQKLPSLSRGMLTFSRLNRHKHFLLPLSLHARDCEEGRVVGKKSTEISRVVEGEGERGEVVPWVGRVLAVTVGDIGDLTIGVAEGLAITHTRTHKLPARCQVLLSIKKKT